MTRVEKKLSAFHTNVYCDPMITTDCFISRLDLFIFVLSVNKWIPLDFSTV